MTFEGLDDSRTDIPQMSETVGNQVEVSRYTDDQCYKDMMRVTGSLTDADLAQ